MINTFECLLSKMKVEDSSPIRYSLITTAGESVPLNPFLGKTLRIEYQHVIQCVHCHKHIPKTFGEGLCFNCFRRLACADLCIVKPSLCHFDKGTCREEEWGKSHCFIPHYVYVSYTSGYKIGITRKTNAITRWIDQGALTAAPLAEVKIRKESGLIEDFITQTYNDKTNWRQMLKTMDTPDSFPDEFSNLQLKIQQNFPEVSLFSYNPHVFTYPYHSDQSTIKSINLEKTPHFESKFLGIKGQYMELSSGFLNIRSHTGKKVKFSFS